MTETVNGVAFGLLAFASILGALAMMWSRNVMYSAFWLLEVMVASAGLYLLLDAEYLALVQVLVYAGAVTVLMLFVIMLTLRRREDATRPRDLSAGAAAMAAVFLGVMFIAIGADHIPVAEMPAIVPDVGAFGELLFTDWMIPFEIASVVLLVALVAAVWWSKGGDE